jgi:hypothetical protein
VDARSAAETLRGEGHALVERMADYLAEVAARPVSTALSPGELRGPRAELAPTELRGAIHLAHPRFSSWVDGRMPSRPARTRKSFDLVPPL